MSFQQFYETQTGLHGKKGENPKLGGEDGEGRESG